MVSFRFVTRIDKDRVDTVAAMSQVRVLIADDEPIIRLDLRQMLESLGYEVVGEAGDGKTAVALARELKPDVCILDVKMPVMDGIEAVDIITEENIAPTILLTAYSDKELIDRARAAGVFAYLVKPFKPSDLAPSIEVARARFEQNVLLNKEVTNLSQRLEARKAIDRAKGILMDSHSLGEAEAYRRIQVQSMNLRKTMQEVAEAIILAKSI
jgi:response regulator NasT